MKKLKFFYILLGFICLFFVCGNSLGNTLEEKFARHVVKMILDRDVNSVYGLGNDKFKRAVTKDQLRKLIYDILDLYKGKRVKNIVLVKFVRNQNLPESEISEVWLKLVYEDNMWLLVKVFTEKSKGKLFLLGLRLNVCPQVFSEVIKSYPYYKETIQFAHKVMDLINKGEIDLVINLVSVEVKQKVEKQFIRNFLSSLKGLKVEKLLQFKWNKLEDGYYYNLILQGVLNGSKVNIELLIKKRLDTNKFELLDLNLFKS